MIASPLLSAAVLAAMTAACSESSAQGAVAADRTAPAQGAPAEAPAATGRPADDAAPAGSVVDAPLAEYRLELLDLAYRSASAFPLDPHHKNRARAQERVVVACFDLDQPHRALEYAEGIENWRRGAAYADFAYYCAQRGELERVEELLDEAMEVALADESAQLQGWRVDCVRAKVARVHTLLGDDERARHFADGIDPSQARELEQLQAELTGPDALEAHMEVVDQAVEIGQFELTRNALARCTAFYDHLYEDEQVRTALAEKIQASWGRLPSMLRLEFLYSMIRSAADHDDPETAAALANLATEVYEGANWDAEEGIRQRARLAHFRHVAGDTEGALEAAAAALAEYEERREEIVNMWRAGVLRPLAEAYVDMGRPGEAAGVYRLALEEGILNPNSRPRCDDLVDTCVSMARNEFEPDEDLWDFLREIHANLSDPW